MGHLDRYKKSGGFIQLLELIESFPTSKQEKFLGLVEEENPLWAKTIREKMLTAQRIMGWPSSTLAEIAPVMGPKMMAVVLKGISTSHRDHFMAGLPSGEKRKIELEMGTISEPQPGELASALFKLVSVVRKMIKDSFLRIEAVDPNVLITEKTEELLLKAPNALKTGVPKESQEEQASENSASEEESPGLRFDHPSTREPQGDGANPTLILNLQKEIKLLKAENKSLKDKLEAIRKIA